MFFFNLSTVRAVFIIKSVSWLGEGSVAGYSGTVSVLYQSRAIAADAVQKKAALSVLIGSDYIKNQHTPYKRLKL